MEVYSLPYVLSKNVSDGFGQLFLDSILPNFFNGDKQGVLERARMTAHGKLTERFSYLQDYVYGK